MTTYICPVCGFAGLEEPPERFSICPSCGTEFENHDYDVSHAELRRRWIASGAKWWSIYDPTPSYWSPIDQLANISYVATRDDLASLAADNEAPADTIVFRAPNVNKSFKVVFTSNEAQIVITKAPMVSLSKASARQERFSMQPA